MIIKKPFLLFAFMFFLVCSPLSCSQNESPARDDVFELIVAGELKHKQYWNKNDNWDLNGLYVYAKYSDGSDNYYSFNSNVITFCFEPAKPTDGITELTIKDIYYIDYLNAYHLVDTEKKFQVTIIDYPYDYAKISISDVIIPIIIGAIILLISAFLAIFYYNKKRKKL